MERGKIMSKEELEKLKEELKKEVRAEIESAIKDNQKNNLWQTFIKEEVQPVLEKKINDNRNIYHLKLAFNSIARIYSKKNHVCKISEEDLEKIKPLINSIVNEF